MQSVNEGGGSLAKWFAFLLPVRGAPGLIPSVPPKNFRGKKC